MAAAREAAERTAAVLANTESEPEPPQLAMLAKIMSSLELAVSEHREAEAEAERMWARQGAANVNEVQAVRTAVRAQRALERFGPERDPLWIWDYHKQVGEETIEQCEAREAAKDALTDYRMEREAARRETRRSALDAKTDATVY